MAEIFNMACEPLDSHCGSRKQMNVRGAVSRSIFSPGRAIVRVQDNTSTWALDLHPEEYRMLRFWKSNEAVYAALNQPQKNLCDRVTSADLVSYLNFPTTVHTLIGVVDRIQDPIYDHEHLNLTAHVFTIVSMN